MELPAYQATGGSELSGTFGDNGGFSWKYNQSAATLTVTGEDSGLANMRHYLSEMVLENMRNIVFLDIIVSGSLDYLLSWQSNIESVVFNNFDTSNVSSMSCMFCGCSSLKTLDASGFDTGNVVDMGFMFSTCENLKRLDMSNFDTSCVMDFDNMFQSC